MRTAILVLGLALTVTVPPSVQGWAGKGGSEPDTNYDATHGWMYTGTDTTPCSDATCSTGPNDVYLNGFLGAVVGYYGENFPTDINPNVATLGTGVPTFPDSPKAMLGVWKDCNKDGYIGLGDQGLYEYSATILTALGSNVCPAGAPPTHDAIVHNDGKWVHEFVPIGFDDRGASSTVDPSPWNVNDWASSVWVDDGLPGSPPTGTCYTLAYPPGSFHSVGGMESVLDCYLTNHVEGAAQTVCGATSSCGTWTTIKATQNPWGNESGSSDANVWDCGSTVATLPPEANVHAAIHAPKQPPTVSTSGSLAGTANATGSGLTTTCTPSYSSSETNPGRTLAHEPYTYEADVNQINGVKFATDWMLAFTEPTRAPVVTAAMGAGTPDDGGVGGTIYHRGYWSTPSVRALSRNPFVDRTLLAPQSVTVYSYYAYVSPQAISDYHLSLPSTPFGSALVTGTYGAEACGGFTTGVHGGWDCNAKDWYAGGNTGSIYYGGCRNVNLGPGPDGQGVDVCPRPGTAYDLVDVDCYDTSAKGLRDAGVGYGALTGTSCTGT